MADSPSCHFCRKNLPAEAAFCPACGYPQNDLWQSQSLSNTFMSEWMHFFRGIRTTMDADVLMKRVSESLEPLVQAEASIVLLYDAGKKWLYAKSATGEKGALVGHNVIPEGEGLCGSVAKSRQGVIVNDAASDARFSATFDNLLDMQPRSLLVVPMMAGTELVGVLAAINKRSPQGFQPNDQSLIEQMAMVTAYAIKSARTLSSLRNFFSNGLEFLVEAIESVHPDLRGRGWRVAEHANWLGRELGVPEQQVKDLYHASLLYDIGTFRVSVIDAAHINMGAEMVMTMDGLKGASPLIAMHHEYYDGSGVPRGLQGEQMPLAASILSLLVSCEEMRLAKTPEENIIKVLLREAGTRYHPKVAQAYISYLQDQ